MEQKRTLRAALYVRVSTDEQANEGFSLDAQVSKLKAYCKLEGWTVSAVYCEEGESGRSIKRPQYQKMMSESDSWDVILVYKMDRIHRNSVNFAKMMEELDHKGKEFCSVQEKFDTSTAMGRFVRDVMERIAQLESEQIGERVKQGMERKAKFGAGLLGSGHPYGYDNKYGRLSVNEEEQYTVRAIFNMYINGTSMDRIAESLNKGGVPAKRGGIWYKSTVYGILHNPLYAGYVKWDGHIRPGDHSAIIELDTFEKVNGPLDISK